MPISQELLEYQRVDGELLKIEQELSASEERKKYLQAKKFIEAAGEKLEAQDKHAEVLRATAEKLTEELKEIEKLIAEYSELDEMVESGGDIAFYKKNVQSLSERLRTPKGELATRSSNRRRARGRRKCKRSTKRSKKSVRTSRPRS